MFLSFFKGFNGWVSAILFFMALIFCFEDVNASEPNLVDTISYIENGVNQGSWVTIDEVQQGQGLNFSYNKNSYLTNLSVDDKYLIISDVHEHYSFSGDINFHYNPRIDNSFYQNFRLTRKLYQYRVELDKVDMKRLDINKYSESFGLLLRCFEKCVESKETLIHEVEMTFDTDSLSLVEGPKYNEGTSNQEKRLARADYIKARDSYIKSKDDLLTQHFDKIEGEVADKKIQDTAHISIYTDDEVKVNRLKRAFIHLLNLKGAKQDPFAEP